MITERIRQIIDYKQLSERAFCREIGVANGFLNKVKDVGVQKLGKILYTYPEINPVWLLTGNGSMIQKQETADSELKMKLIPLANAAAIGGSGISSFGIEAQDVKDYYVVPKFQDRQVDFMIEVLGASMEPLYHTGDIVACRIITESGFIQWNQVHLIATKGQGIIIKRIHEGLNKNSLRMVSDNPEYEPFDVPKNEITGIALVVGAIRLE
jgi:phage repressor protein C with HTH and peptisase S24 domain